jgi:dTDP-4-amino-4,6-dideoxygalactose transaminase
MTTAEGGMVVTDDSQISERLRRLRSHGMTSLSWDRHRGHSFSYDVVEIGHNYRIDEIRAALGRVQLAKLQENNSSRREKYTLLRAMIRDRHELSIPFSDDMLASSSCHIFPILLERPEMRPAFMEYMKTAGIQTSIHYPPVHLFKAYRCTGQVYDSLTITEDVASREVTLPLYPDILPEQIEMIALELSKSFRAIANDSARSAARLAV